MPITNRLDLPTVDDDQYRQFVQADNAVAPMRPPTAPLSTSAATNVIGRVRQAAAGPAGGAFRANMELQNMVQPYGDKRNIRSMSKNERLQFLSQKALEASGLGELRGRQPQNQLSLRVPNGGTYDQFYGDDYADMDPATQVAFNDAMGQFDKQFSRMMAGTDSTKFNDIDDIMDAVNALPVVRSHGSLIEGHIRDRITKSLPPDLKGQLDANDATHGEFAKWYEAKNLGAGGQTPEAAWDEMHGSGAFAGSPKTQRARMLRQQFEDDSDYRKFEYNRATGKVEPLPVTESQKLRMAIGRDQALSGFQSQQQAREAEAGRQQDIADFNALPESVRSKFFIYGGKVVPLPEEKPKEGFATAEEAKAKAAELSASLGIPHRAIVGKGGRFDVEEVKEQNPYKLSRMDNAAAMIAAGEPVFRVGKDSFAMRGDEAYDSFFRFFSAGSEKREISADAYREQIKKGFSPTKEMKEEAKAKLVKSEGEVYGVSSDATPSPTPASSPATSATSKAPQSKDEVLQLYRSGNLSRAEAEKHLERFRK